MPRPRPEQCLSLSLCKCSVLKCRSCSLAAYGTLSQVSAQQAQKRLLRCSWEPGSYGYHGVDGKRLHKSASSSRDMEDYAETYTAGDVVGAGIILGRQDMFFTCAALHGWPACCGPWVSWSTTWHVTSSCSSSCQPPANAADDTCSLTCVICPAFSARLSLHQLTCQLCSREDARHAAAPAVCCGSPVHHDTQDVRTLPAHLEHNALGSGCIAGPACAAADMLLRP